MSNFSMRAWGGKKSFKLFSTRHDKTCVTKSGSAISSACLFVVDVVVVVMKYFQTLQVKKFGVKSFFLRGTSRRRTIFPLKQKFLELSRNLSCKKICDLHLFVRSANPLFAPIKQAFYSLTLWKLSQALRKQSLGKAATSGI